MTERANPPDLGPGLERDDPRPDLSGNTEMRRLHPLTPLVKSWVVVAAGIGYLWTQLSSLVEGQLFGSSVTVEGDAEPPISILGAIFFVALVAALVYGYFYWRFTKYGIVGNVLQVQTGAIFRQSRQVKLDRLQAVDIVRPLIARLLGLAELRLEVAGGGSSEAPLAFLSLANARQLRAELLARAAGLDATTPEASQRPLIRVPTRQLAVGSLLSGTTVLLVAVGFGLAVAGVITGTVAFLVPFVPALIGLVFAALRHFVTNYGFTVAESADGLRITKGLIDTRAQTVPPGRVQAVGITQPLLWRSLDLVRLDVNVAGYAAHSESETEKTSVLLPVGERAIAYEILLARVVRGTRVAALELTRAPARARWLRPIGWRYLAAGISGSVFATTHGWVRHELVLMPHAKPQSMRITQGPVQRWLGLATVGLDSTKGPVSVHALHRDAGEARAMLDREVALEREARLAAAPDRWELADRPSTDPREALGQRDPDRLYEPAEPAQPGAVEQLGGGSGVGEGA
jgi:putative membrane protein